MSYPYTGFNKIIELKTIKNLSPYKIVIFLFIMISGKLTQQLLLLFYITWGCSFAIWSAIGLHFGFVTEAFLCICPCISYYLLYRLYYQEVCFTHHTCKLLMNNNYWVWLFLPVSDIWKPISWTSALSTLSSLCSILWFLVEHFSLLLGGRKLLLGSSF